MRILTRGLTGSASAIVVQGFTGAAFLEVVRIIKGGRSAASRAVKDLYEDFKISAMLVALNGKEFVNPIFNKVKKSFISKDSLVVKVQPKKLVARKSDNISVKVSNIKVRNKNERD